nr:40S ribosomal protein S4 [Ipomoea batatas]
MRTSTYFMIPNDDSVFPRLEMKRQRTIRYPDPLIKANDTVKLDLESNKIVDFIKFNCGINLQDCLAMLISLNMPRMLEWPAHPLRRKMRENYPFVLRTFRTTPIEIDML